MRVVSVLLLLLAASGCAPELDPSHQPDGGGGAGSDGGSGGAGGSGGSGGGAHVKNSDNGDGTTTTRIDARDSAAWVYFSFATKAETNPAMPESSNDWELGFQRFKIKSNGGVSGAGAISVARLPGADFAGLTQAPATGYATDAAGDARVFEVGDGWYAYDISTHVLTARAIVYVVKSGDRYYKMKLSGYYDEAGSPGYLTFTWAPVSAPPASDALTVDASSASAWTYVSLRSGRVVTVADPAASKDWDLAFRRTQIATNGGTSGGGLGGAQRAPDGASYDGTTLASDQAQGVPRPRRRRRRPQARHHRLGRRQVHSFVGLRRPRSFGLLRGESSS